MGIYAVSALAMLVWPQLAAWSMERFHLRSESFVAWALFQPSPWMYNFENEYLVSDRPLTRAEVEAPPRGLGWQAINHQSARVFTFAEHRVLYLANAGTRYFYLNSRYRGVVVHTAYRIDVQDPPGVGARAASVRRAEFP